MKYTFCFVWMLLVSSAQITFANTWVDSLDAYAREQYLPAEKYSWTWQNAALLHTMVQRYELGNEQEKETYLNYVKTAMNDKFKKANGKTPNAVASGLGMAFLYKITKDEKYLKACEKIYKDYLQVKRTEDGAISHLRLFPELWDDTVFMIGQFLLQMYQATDNALYLDEFVKQYRLHREKLQDPEQKLWVHGWDANDRGHCTFCSQNRWPDKETRKSKEFWGRGNGWIVVTLSNALDIIPEEHPYWKELAGDLTDMLEVLPAVQDSATGHWYQLPMRPEDKDIGNYLESSCTAMFAYGMSKAMQHELVSGVKYEQAIERAYNGLRNFSLYKVDNGYLNTQNVCKGTCIGDKYYYYKRNVRTGRSYAIGMFIQFGVQYERMRGIR